MLKNSWSTSLTPHYLHITQRRAKEAGGPSARMHRLPPHGLTAYKCALRALAGGLRASHALASSFCLCSSICSQTFFLPLILLPPPQLRSQALSTWTPGRMLKCTCHFFFTQKDHPAPQKLKFCMKKIVFFYSKIPPSTAKNRFL